MKRGKTDTKIATKKVIKPQELRKIKIKLKSKVYSRLLNKHDSDNTAYTNKIIDNLIFNKNTHMAVEFRDCMILDFTDEFLKRYYKVNESKERVPKIANYYKNYLTFFCNPVFRDFRTNGIIQIYSDNKAELYYNKTYSNKPKKEGKKTGNSFLFNSIVRDDINNHVLTEVSEDNRNNDTSIFNDEFFIYRPDKKRAFNDQETSFFLNYSKNNSHIKSGLLTMQSREEDILNIVSNLNKPMNERIIDKIQKSKNSAVKSTYNFSTTDKSKGSEISGNFANNLNNLAKKGNELQIQQPSVNQEAKVAQKLIKDPNILRESRKIDGFQMTNSETTKNVSNPPQHGSINIKYISEKIGDKNQEKNQESLHNKKHSVDLFNVSNVPSTSKNKPIIKEQSQSIVRFDKSPTPVTVKNSKIVLTGRIESGTIASSNSGITSGSAMNSNKLIDYKPLKYEKPTSSTSKFANLLYSNSNDSKEPSSTTNAKVNSQRSNSNNRELNLGINKPTLQKSQAQAPKMTHQKNTRSIDLNKFNVDLETPTNQHLQLNHNIDYFTSTTNKNTEEKQTPTNGIANGLSLNFNKVSRSRGLSGSNYDNLLLSKGKQDKSIGKKDKPEVDVYISDINKMKKLNSDNNFISSNLASSNNPSTNSKYNNYISNMSNNNNTSTSKKATTTTTNINSNFLENSHRMMSSYSVKGGGTNSQVKIKFNTNERVSSSRGTGNDAKVNLNNYYTLEPKGSVTTKSYSKTKEIKDSNIIITDKSIKKTPINRRQKSGDFFSNNYLTTNNSNMNVFLQKISSTRNIAYGDKNRKNQFSPAKKATTTRKL